MQIINRKGPYNDVMFEDMSQFSQYQIETTAYKHTVKLLKDDKEIAELEDVRIIFNKPSECQVKARVAVADKHIVLNKSDAIKVQIKSKAPSLEPPITITVTKWFEETSDFVPNMDKAPVAITPNKWLYLKGTK